MSDIRQFPKDHEELKSAMIDAEKSGCSMKDIISGKATLTDLVSKCSKETVKTILQSRKFDQYLLKSKPLVQSSGHPMVKAPAKSALKHMPIRSDVDRSVFKSDVKPVTEPVVKPVPKPVVKPVPKPVVKPVPKPVVKPVPKPVVKPVPKPVAKPVPEPVVKHLPKPVVKPVPKPVVKPVQKPVVKPVPKPVVKPVPKPVVKPVPKPV